MVSNLPRPKIIGICGQPQHGKTTAQAILETIGVRAADDSAELRLLAMRKWDLTWGHVSTQEGKASIITAYGREMTVREAVGLLGQEDEKEFGSNIWVERALSKLLASGDTTPVSLGSIRMNQGAVVKAAGGIVVEIVDPRKSPSPHDFDQYEARNVDIRVENDRTLHHLRWRLINRTYSYLDLTFSQLMQEANRFKESVS